MINLEINLARLENERSALEMQYDELHTAYVALEAKYDELREEHYLLTANYYSILNQLIDLQKEVRNPSGQNRVV